MLVGRRWKLLEASEAHRTSLPTPVTGLGAGLLPPIHLPRSDPTGGTISATTHEGSVSDDPARSVHCDCSAILRGNLRRFGTSATSP